MIVVCDTSPISALFLIGRLDLLEALFGDVYIPESVYNELLALEDFGIDILEIKNAPWLIKRSPTNADLVERLLQLLDNGESEAIALALELRADLLLMDERRGREIALHEGLATMGILGVLVQAKSKNLISEVRPLLDVLRNEVGFWIADALYWKIIELAGE